jgi:GTP pyrophosphokinase
MSIDPLLEKLKKSGKNSEELELVRRAFEFAKRAHGTQKRLSGEPYITHPICVAENLADLTNDAATIEAAILHDVPEDTDYSIDDIKKEFGGEVAFLVEGVTKLDRIKYRGTERQAENLRKMFLAIAEDIRVVLIKLVDRLHNMKTIQHLPAEKQKRIALETIEIYAPLAYRLGMGEIKGQLEDLAFPIVSPKEHDWLMKNLRDHFDGRKKYVERILPIVAEELKKEKINFLDIHARAKHYYSLYRKLLKYDMDINKVFDLVAVRIILPGIEDCYGALGVIHKLWRPVPGLIKDYIALPKPNGYRSLHTTVFGPEGKIVEFQARTLEMHEEAEKGIAAHWAYSEQKGTKSYAEKKPVFGKNNELKWVSQLREWQKDFDKPDEFLDALKIDFFKNRIFVLSPKGDVFDLPEGATPIDFAYAVHTDIGNTAVGSKVNSRMTPLHYELHNGDVVEILTQKNKKPSSDWLDFVKTATARKRISSFVKKSRESLQFSRPAGQLVEFKLTVRDRIGLLKDITSLIARQKINMKSVATETKNRLYPVVIIQAPLKTKDSLEKLMVKLKEIKGVEEVGYKLLN